EDVQNALFDAMFNGKLYVVVRRVVWPDGAVRYVRAIGEVTFNGVGVPLRLMGTILDISDKKEDEKRLLEQIRKNESILESAGEGIIGLDGEGRVIFANPAATRMLGYSQEELRQISPHDTWQCLYPDRRPYPARKSPIRWAYRKGVASNVDNEVFWRKNGSSFFVHYIATPAGIDGSYKGAVIVFKDITEQKRNEELLQAISMEDDLTGLYNRRGFLAVAEQEVKTARRNQWGIIMVYADVDRMKWINDNLGHEEGDAALIEAATVLKETFREADIIGRVGGDEFAVLATETGSEVALGDLTLLLKERLTKITAGHNAASGRKYQLSMSIGVKRCGPGCCHSVNELLNQADQLMYEDKRQRGVGR
ncbi:MAG: diguanylate cyclase, partial [Actinomycetota bacterium]